MYHELYSFARSLCSVLNKLERKDELVSLPGFSKSRMSKLDILDLAQLAQSLIKNLRSVLSKLEGKKELLFLPHTSVTMLLPQG